MESNADFCSYTGGKVHSYHDYRYWDDKHPKCSWCGYLDVSRVIKEDK